MWSVGTMDILVQKSPKYPVISDLNSLRANPENFKIISLISEEFDDVILRPFYFDQISICRNFSTRTKYEDTNSICLF